MALSPLQEGLYSLTALAEFVDDQPADDPYVIGMAADISGALDVALAARLRGEDVDPAPESAGQLLQPGDRAAGADRAVTRRAAVAVTSPRCRADVEALEADGTATAV